MFRVTAPVAPMASITLLFLMMTSPPSHAQSVGSITRAQVITDVGETNIGAGYAQMLNFFVDPSISVSRLEDSDGTEYDVFKLPLQTEFPLNERGLQLAVRGTLSYATAENSFAINQTETIDGSWEASSGQIGLGLIGPITDRLSWIAATHLGVSRLESDADYNTQLGRELLAPLLDGVLFNWDTNATIAGISGGLDYKQRIADRYDLDVAARYTYSQIDSYSESGDLAPFKEDTGTMSITADLDHPWNREIGSLPLFGTVHLGGTAFTGPNRDALGFTHFYLVGYSVGLDVAESNRYFNAFSIGAHANFGSDVDGYSLRFGWRLK